ncbi:MAG: hypothetical protein B6V02_01530 [Thermoprotei archaeon ex4572_64]|nr:MAG: hypothetical protein B6V02_01530 [Thermoprotei archaeon ex4572_64]
MSVVIIDRVGSLLTKLTQLSVDLQRTLSVIRRELTITEKRALNFKRILEILPTEELRQKLQDVDFKDKFYIDPSPVQLLEILKRAESDCEAFTKQILKTIDKLREIERSYGSDVVLLVIIHRDGTLITPLSILT